MVSDGQARISQSFNAVATGYSFLVSNTDLLSTSLKTIKSLTDSLGMYSKLSRNLHLQDLAFCSIIYPEMVSFESTGTEIRLTMPGRKRKRKSKTNAYINELCQAFDSKLNSFFKTHGNDAMSMLKSKSESSSPNTISIDGCLLSISGIVASFRNESYFKERILSEHFICEAPKIAQYGSLDFAFNLGSNHETVDIDKLYSHQTAALNVLHQGGNIVVSTSTSSGKSLIYQLAILSEIKINPSACALLIFPTKALSQDQNTRFTKIASTYNINCNISTFDGDTPLEQRKKIRSQSNVILTNPDMIHVSILPFHTGWKSFLKELKIVMIDELHYYGGSLGAHLSLILTRLRRLCAFYGNTKLQFIGCSATMSEPLLVIRIDKHAEALFGLPDIKSIANDGSPSSVKNFVVWKPPLRTQKLGALAVMSIPEECSAIAIKLMVNQIRTIIFARSRKDCEMIYKEIKQQCRIDNPRLAGLVMSYRGGYSISERRDVESRLFSGELLCVVATNALELGVDIGSLDVVVHAGFPSSVSSFLQQSGRVGRRGKEALDILILDLSSPKDYYYLKNADQTISYKSIPKIAINLSEEIIGIHLNCAAHEIPLRHDDNFFQSPIYQLLIATKLRYDSVQEDKPAYLNPIRAVDEGHYSIYNRSDLQLLEEITISRVPYTLYQNAIHINQGQSFLVTDIDHESKEAFVRSIEVDYITIPYESSTFDPQSESVFTNACLRAPINIGAISVVKTFLGYHKMNTKTKFIYETVESAFQDTTTKEYYGLWMNIQISDALNRVDEILKGIHTIQHCILILCGSRFEKSFSLSSRCCTIDRAIKNDKIMIFDSSNRKSTVFALSKAIPTILLEAQLRIQGCICPDGCENCINN